MADLQITVRADLFRIAYHAVSTEETRYYLNGVFVEPHADGGVTLTSTDGHRLLSVYDREGSASEAAIIKLPSDALKACKLGKGDASRSLRVNGDEARVVATDLNGEERPVAITTNFVIDGTFPDWRKVLPRGPFDKPATATFNATYLSGLASLAKDIAVAFEIDEARVKVLATSEMSPALVLFSSIAEAFAVLMPMRDVTANAVPAFAGAADVVEPAPAKSSARAA